jgi:hypothetical protein
MFAYSDDGSTNTSWKRYPGSDITAPVYGIAYGNGRFVAVGRNGFIAYSDRPAE